MNEMVNDDARLVAAAKSGDQLAFARLYDRHAPIVLSLCRRSCGGSLTEAEDATQETFLRAHQRLHMVVDASGFRPWLYAIARRVCSERRRSSTRRGKHEGLSMLNTAPRTMPTARDEAQRHEMLARLGDAIDRLDERERLALHLFYLEADPVRAAASALGLSRSGYYKLMARARERLAVLMEVQPS